MQFYSDFFVFNGVNSKDNDYYIITTNSYTNEYDFGLKSTIVSEKGVGQVPTFIEREDSIFDINLQITKLDKGGRPLPFSDDDKRFLSKWLFKKHPCPLYVDDLVFYVVAKTSAKWFNTSNNGYITVTFESCSPYAYSPIKTNWERINKNEDNIFNLPNNSSVSDYEYLDISLIRKTKSKWIEFYNEDLDEYFKIDNLTDEDININIYGEDLKYIENKDMLDKNMRKLLVEYKSSYPRLGYGSNRLIVRSDGEWEIQIKYQEKQTMI